MNSVRERMDINAAYREVGTYRFLDRLLHHAVVVATEGESYRMKQARKRGAPTTTTTTTT